MKKQILYIMCGLGFSGKSTMSRAIEKHTGAILVSQDAVYWDKKVGLDPTLTEEEEWKQILTLSKEEVRSALRGGYSVVFDNINVTKKERDDLKMLVDGTEAIPVVVYMNTSEQIRSERYAKNKDLKERHDVLEKHLEKAKKDFEMPTDDETLIILSPDIEIEERLKKLDAFVETL